MNRSKLLAAVAVMAMVFAAFAVVSLENDSDAAAPVAGDDQYGPLSFKTAYVGSIAGSAESYTYSNEGFGNNISVYYDATAKTYYLSGTIAVQENKDYGNNATDTQKSLWKMSPEEGDVACIVYHANQVFKQYKSDGSESTGKTGKMMFGINTLDSEYQVTNYGEKIKLTFDVGEDGKVSDKPEHYFIDMAGLKTSAAKDNWTAGSVTLNQIGTMTSDSAINVDKTVTITGAYTGDLNITNGTVNLLEGASITGSARNTVDGVENIVKLENIEAGSSGMTLSAGSVVITGSYTGGADTGVITVTGQAKISGSLESNVTIKFANADAVLSIPEGKTLSLGSNTLTIDDNSDAGTLAVLGNITKTTSGATTGNIVTNGAKIGITETTDKSVFPAEGVTYVSAYASSSEYTGYEGTIDGDTVINGKAYLANNLVIAEGATLTVNGTLDLNGKDLKILGNLSIGTKGAVIGSDGANGKDSITLTKTGAIDSNGLIGKGNYGVTVKYDAQSVKLHNVAGAVFEISKNNGLTVSGNITKITGYSTGTITIAGAVVTGELTISKNITLVSSGFTVAKNGVLTINGTLNATTGVVMANGSTINMNGKFFGSIEAQVEDGIAAGEAWSEGTTTVSGDAFNASNETATGFVLEVKQNQYTDDAGDVLFDQRLYISGTIVATKVVTEGKVDGIKLDGTIFVDSDAKLTLAKSGAIDKGVSADSAILVVYGLVENLKSITMEVTYMGTAYTITPETAGSDPVVYVTSFEDAFAVIDTVDDKTIVFNGNETYGYELNNSITVKAGQTIDGLGEAITIGENSVVTVESEGTLDAGVLEKIEGMLVVMDGASCTPDSALYDVVSKNENNDITYAGFQVIINNATAGDVITISGQTAKVNTVTVANGVKVVVADGAKLTVTKSMTIAEGGELVVDGILNVGTAATATTKAVPGQLNVAGKATVVDGTLTMYGGDATTKAVIASTGDFVYKTAQPFGSNYSMSGAVYADSDGDMVLTTISKAIEGAAANDNKVTIIGEVNDSTAIVLGDVEVTVTGTAVLGDVDITGSKIIANGTLTANIIGDYGEAGSVADAAVKVVKATGTFEDSSKINSKNIEVWSLTVSALDGTATISQGTVVLKNTATGADKETFTVSAGATLSIINADVSITGYEKTVIDGTVMVDKAGVITFDDVTVNGDMTVDGIANADLIVVVGTLTVTNNEAISGSVSVDKLQLGETPETLAAGATVVGKVTLNAGAYALAYPGSTVSEENFGDANSVYSTEFYINGGLFVTAYALANDIEATGEGFLSEISLEGYKLAETGNEIVNADSWSKSADMKDKLADGSTITIGSEPAFYYEATPGTVEIQFSVGSKISVYVDGLKILGSTKDLEIGEHTITATIDPGYKGDVVLTFNGQTITDGKFVITADMQDGVVVSATGNITVDTGSTSSDNGGMGITDYLLIILVVMVVILAIVVIMRMMRS